MPRPKAYVPPPPPPRAPPPPSRAALASLVLLPTVLVVAPGAAERLGVPFEDESLRLPLVLLALGAALLPSHRSRWGPDRWRAIAEVVGFGAVAAALLATGPAPSSVWAWVGTPLAFLSLVAGFAAGGRRLRSEEARGAFLRGLALASLATAAWVLVDRLAGRAAATGPLGRAGIAGPTLAALLPIASAWTRERLATRPLALRWAPTALVAAALLATESRTALAAGALAFAFAEGLARQGAEGRTWLAGVGALAVAGGLVVGLSIAGWLPGGSWAGRTDTVRIRAGLAGAAARLVVERPLSGFGPHGFAAESLRVRDAEEARLSDGRRPLLAHDDYLQVAVAGGVLLGAAFLGAVVLCVVLAARGALGAAVQRRRRAAAVAGALLATALAALAEDPFCASATAATFGLLAGGWLLGDAVAKGVAVAEGVMARVVDGAAASIALGGAALLLVALTFSPARLLATGAFRRDERSRAAAYHHCVALAKEAELGDSMEAYRTLLAFDPGATEARFDVANLFRIAQGSVDDAREALAEARRHDPRRYEVPLLRGHLLLGPEAAPSRRTPPEDPTSILRLYDEAASLEGPLGRFETHVAFARVYRRLGRLADAAGEMGKAKEVAARRGRGLPGELLLESFRLAEAEGASSMDSLGVLVLALAADPNLRGEVGADATACLLAAEEEEAQAKARVARTLKLDVRAADLDFDAAALRLSGLLLVGFEAPERWREVARLKAAKGLFRSAVAVYRALLSDPFATPDADLALEAAASAQRVDPGLQRNFAARGRTLLGYEALAKGDLAAAAKDFEVAIEKHPEEVAALYGLAKVKALGGQADAAVQALAKAVRLDPRARDRARGDADLSPLLPRLP